MDKNVLKLWTDALRSGKYTQGQFHLKNNDTYCCLGVLAEELGLEPADCEKVDIFEQHEHNYPADLDNFEVWPLQGHNGDPGVFLPPDLAEKYGFTTDEHVLISELNDDYSVSFKELATIIEFNADKI